MTRVCIVAGGPPNAGFGLEYIAFRIARSLVNAGAEVDFFFPGCPSARAFEGVKLKPVRFIPSLFGAKHVAFSVLSIFHMQRNYDVVNTHGEWGAGVAIATLGTRLIHTFHSTRPATAESWRNRPGLRRPLVKVSSSMLSMAESICSRVAEICVAVSPKVRNEVLRFYNPKKCVVIINEVAPHPCRFARHKGEHPKVALITHRDLYAKGVDVLLKTAALLPDFSFSVIGGTNSAVSNNVKFLGRLSHEEVMKQLLAHDIFIAPSRYEGLSIGILEALATGMPVVCSREAAPPDLSIFGAGETLESYEPQQYAEAINRVAADIELFSKGALAYAERHDGTDFAKQYQALILDQGPS